MEPLNCIVMGAAGRDFHDFQVFLRHRPELRVRCFTGEQIPFITERSFPRALAGPDYDEDIPICPEDDLEALVERYEVDLVFLAYSDLSHEDVMHKASRVQAAGAGFVLLGPRQTMLHPRRPTIAVTATRTGAGKSPLSLALASHLAGEGHHVAVMRHPMPYGDLARQAVQRFAMTEDLDRHDCTVEEREEYLPYLARGLTVFAGVDYGSILEAAEAESDVLLWDGGNNDLPFVRPGLWFVVADALRPGHEVGFYPGETNLRSANVVVISKVGQARPEDVEAIRERAGALNPDATVLEADLRVEVEEPEMLRGRRVLVVEDGPSLTHGGLPWGAGTLAARRAGASELVDPRRHAVGSIAQAFRTWEHLGAVLPALGYSERQRAELAETIRRAAPDVVVDASPSRVTRSLDLGLPIAVVGYAFEQVSGPAVESLVDVYLAEAQHEE